MALTVTFLAGNASFNTTSGTKTTSSTLTVGDLLVIVTGHSGNTSSATPTDNNAGGGGTYTKITSATSAAGVDTLSVFVRDALVTNVTSTTFTHAPGTTTGGGLVVYKVSGMTRTGAAAVLQSAVQNNQAGGGTPTPVLGAAAKTGNGLIGAVLNATSPATLTPRSSPAWTEGNDTGYSTPTTGFESMSISSGETGTSIAWGGTSASAFGSLVIELDARQIYTLTSSAGSYALTGATVTLAYGRKITASSGSFALSGSAATLKAGRVISAGSGSFALSGSSASFLAGRKIAAGSGSFALTGSSAALKTGRKLTAGSGSFTLAGSSASLLAGRYLSAGSGSFVLSGSSASLPVGRKLTAGSGSFALTGSPAALIYATHSGAFTLTAAAGSFVLTGAGAALSVSLTHRKTVLHAITPDYIRPVQSRIGRPTNISRGTR